MLDIVKRTFLHPFDYLGLNNVQPLTFREKRELGGGYWSFHFDTSAPHTWKAGQHGIFSFPNKKMNGGNWRPFSITSSPNEDGVQIGTSIPPEPSEFKKTLMNLISGDTLQLRGPFGEFHPEKKLQHIIGVAGGIGITPFRAIAYDIAHGNLPHISLTLIYSAKTSYPYKEELEQWAITSPQLTVIYVHTPKEVTEELQKKFSEYGNTADYYLSGSPRMITGVTKTCVNIGVSKIVNDPFKGY